MPPVSVMLKPSSSLCNMRCEYCFYHSLSEHRAMPSYGFMSEDTLAATLSGVFAHADGAPVSISFQGGEPLLSGKEFFATAERLIRELNSKGSKVTVCVQTNGTLIDEEWCKFFARNKWLVGLSLDGDRTANALRVTADGEPTFDTVYAAAKLLQKYRVDFNILCVLTKPVAGNIERVYAFYRRNKFGHLQFIPVLKPLKYGVNTWTADGKEVPANGVASASDQTPEKDFYLDAESYGSFLKKAFSLYLKDILDGRYTSIRQFDNFVILAKGGRAEQCGMNGHCTHQYVIESDGSVYPCDFYCLDEYRLGNVHTDTFSEMEKSDKVKRFIEESLVPEDRCKECAYYRLCKNGCKRERTDVDKCAAYKSFFAYALPHLKRLS